MSKTNKLKSLAKNAYTFNLAVLMLLLFKCTPAQSSNAHYSKTGAVSTKTETIPSSAVLNLYLQGIKNRIDHFWFAAKGSNEHVSIAFRINKDGRSYWEEVTDASAVDSVNQSAQDAIIYSSPFPPLPASFPDHLDLVVDFASDYQPLSQLSYSRPIESNLLASRRLCASAVILNKEGQIEKAIESLKKANELTPFDVRVRDKLVETYFQLSQKKPNEQAISLLHKALLLDHTNSAARVKLNELITASGKDAKSFDDRVAMAREYSKSSLHDDALCEYGEAWLLKNDPHLIAEINTICQQRRKYADVLKWQAVLETSDTVENHMILAKAYESCGMLDKALQEDRQASSMDLANRFSTQEALKSLEAKSKEIAGEAKEPDPEVALSDEFPYANFGSRSLTVRVIKDRKVAVDYLDAACPKIITRWATNRVPLLVYLENGAGVPGYRPQFRQFMIDAFAAWVKASEGRLSLTVVNYPNQANIICRWVADPQKGNMTGGELGITHSKFYYLRGAPRNCMVRSAEIYILTIFHGSTLSDVAMRAVCLHELGHALGISGHSPYRGDIMYPTLSPYDIPLRLTDKDAATIKRLYQGYSHSHED